MSADLPDVLVRILKRKQEEVAERQKVHTLESLRQQAEAQTARRGFVRAMQQQVAKGQPAVIAEIKKASPSKGVIRENFDPVAIAKTYEEQGAACLSVLTDRDFFQGHEDYLVAARDAVKLPVIRKDFLIDDYQVYEAKALGADCILLIVAAFPDNPSQLQDLYQLAIGLGMDVLVEVHDEAECEIAMNLRLDMLGINNRNLRNFNTQLDTTLRLARQLPDELLIVTESGIHSADDVRLMQDNGINAFLVGEAFMRQDDPGQALKALFF